MKLKGRNIGVGMLQTMGPRKKTARGREEMNQVLYDILSGSWSLKIVEVRRQ